MAETDNINEFDYSFVESIARVALYDDLKSAPRVTKIEPAATTDYIEHLTTTVYEQSHMAGGKIPYSVIREVSENFIHAQFREIVVSILDEGNTIRFADQGPGIREKEKAQQPGFSSAIEPMKDYIRGVGSGFPIVKDYLNDRSGSIVIEDNLTSGAVITISLSQSPTVSMPQAGFSQNAAGLPTVADSTFAPSIANAVSPTPSPTPRVEHTPWPASATTPVNPLVPAHAAMPAAAITPATAGIAFIPHVPLNEREQTFMKLLLTEGELGVTELHNLTGFAGSTVHNTLKKLEEAGLVTKSTGKKRTLTEIGQQLAAAL